MILICAAIASPRRRRTIAARTAPGLGIGAGVAIQETVPRQFEAPPVTVRATNARLIQNPFDVRNAGTGCVIPDVESAAPVYMGVEDRIHGSQLPKCLFVAFRCSRKQGNISSDFEWPFTRF